MQDAVNVLSISPIDVIDNLDECELSLKQKETILSLDNDIIYDAIYHATKHIDVGEYYREIVDDAVSYLEHYVTSNEENNDSCVN